MKVLPAPKAANLQLYADPSQTEPYYGLPREIAFCKRCVISNQRPNSAVEYQHTSSSKKSTIHFDKEGICDACRFTERKNKTKCFPG